MKFIRRLTLYLVWFLLPQMQQVCLAEEPSTDPILRIELGPHIDDIEGYAMDEGQRWLVTASRDRTARVWDVATGRQMAILRPPSDNVAGTLSKAAITNDGTRIVVGGAANRNWYGSNAAYVFDRQGKLVQVISGLNGDINSIALTPDNRSLIVGTYREIKIFDFSTYAVTATINEGTNANEIAVSRAGWFAYGSHENQSKNGRLTVCRLQGGIPYCGKPMQTAPGFVYSGFAISSDGTRLAVGERFYYQGVPVSSDRGSVRVYSLPALEKLSEFDTAGLDYRGSVYGLQWTPGNCLIGHNLDKVRIWSSGSTARFSDVRGFRRTQRLFPAADCGAMVASSGDLTKIDSASTGPGSPLVQASAPVLPVWLSVVDDWRAIGIPDGSGKASAQRFNLRTRLFEGYVGTVPYVDRGFRLVEDPKDIARSLQSDTSLDTSYNALVMSGRRSVLFSSPTKLSLINADGSVSWTSPVPNRAKRLALSSDGKIVVGFFPDGTVHWFRLSDGMEVLAYFARADNKRWVLWTPSGYYDASPGGEDMIGWHLNRDKSSAADFFPVSRFRSQFYRPDVISKVLDTLDERDALRLANAEAGRRTDASPVLVHNVLPPVMEITYPTDGGETSTSNVTIRYRTRSSDDAPVTAVRARVNGQAVNTRNLVVQGASDSQEITIPIPAQDSEIQLFAENKNGVSTPATVRLKWTGSKPAAREEGQYKPKLYILAVGVSKYANPAYNLGLAAKDAQDFARALAAQKGKLYSEVQVRLLTDTKATRDDVVDGLEWLKREVTARDIGMLFLAGHGINDNTGNYYFMPHNADPERLLRTGVAQNDIKLTLNTLAGKALFFVDTCHSGNVLGTAKTRAIGTDVNAFVNELASAENGVVVFTASTGRQYSLEDPAWGNGAFTKALVEGLSGKADFQRNGKVTHKGLDYYVAERVKELTRGQQSPVSIAPAGVTDFPIAVLGR